MPWIGRPTGVILIPSAAPDLTADPPEAPVAVGAAVTAISEGWESQPSNMAFEENSVDYSTQAGHLEIKWNAVPGADYYNVYRTRLVQYGKITGGEQLGFLGQAYGTSFFDGNIIPDFVTTPPLHYNPFADNAIEHIRLTNAGGSGYNPGSLITINDPTGSGFIGQAVVDDGALVAIIILDGGRGYTDPEVLVSPGTGATFDVELSPASGNDPSVSAVYQQRQLYASNRNFPMRLWGSRPGEFSNFDVSRIVTAGDAYEFDLDAEILGPIHHIIPLRSGLLVFGATGVWNVSGGQEVAVHSLNVVAEPQSVTGAARVEPVLIDSDVLYLEAGGRLARLLRYNEIGKVYAGQNMSVLATHLFNTDNPITKWTYAQSPSNLVWAVREDGSFLSFTIDIEQNVFAWAVHTTKGLVKDLQVLREFGKDVVYLVVERIIGGKSHQFIEKLAERHFEDVEEAWAVDCGVPSFRESPDAVLTPKRSVGDNVVFNTDVPIFTADDVGKTIRGDGGKAKITTFLDTKQVRVNILRPFDNTLPEDPRLEIRGYGFPLKIPSGKWTLSKDTESLDGLRHLEGETVQVFVDGNVQPPAVVTNGRVKHVAGSFVTIGFGYRCVAQTLPPTVSDVPIEGRRKNVVGSAVRVFDTRGLKVGATFDSLYEMKDRTVEPLQDPTMLQRKTQHVVVAAEWDVNGQTLYVQDYPLPATILGLVTELEVGDDPD